MYVNIRKSRISAIKDIERNELARMDKLGREEELDKVDPYIKINVDGIWWKS